MAIELEKKNLEMHVELEALREKTTDDALSAIEEKIANILTEFKELKQIVDNMKDDRNNQLIRWGTAIIVALLSALGLLIMRLIIPAVLTKGAGQ